MSLGEMKTEQEGMEWFQLLTRYDLPKNLQNSGSSQIFGLFFVEFLLMVSTEEGNVHLYLYILHTKHAEMKLS